MLAQKVSATFDVNALVTEAVDIRQAKRVYLEIPTYAIGIITATANIYVQAADTQTGTFRRVQEMGVYSANSGIYAWEIPSGAGNSYTLCRPVIGLDWLKIESSKTATAAMTCYVHIIR